MIKFEWDPRKDGANQRKHGVSFEEAQSVFFDENAIQFYDEHHSEELLSNLVFSQLNQAAA